jgi:hypothetical protein
MSNSSNALCNGPRRGKRHAPPGLRFSRPAATRLSAALLGLYAPVAVVLPAPASARPVPLYASVSRGAHDHIYSQSKPARKSLRRRGYSAAPMVAFIEQTPAGRPLHRLSKRGHHRYTDSRRERARLIAGGWGRDRIVGYLRPAGTPMTSPIFRLTHRAGDQVLTTDQIDRDWLVRRGWSWDATLGNATTRICRPDDTHKSLTFNPASVIGDADSEDFSVWYKLYAAPCQENRGIQFVTSPRREGSFAARYSLAGKGDTVVAHGDRAETILNRPQSRAFEGGEAWFGWSTLFTDEFRFDETNLGTTRAKGSVIFANFHQTNAANPTHPETCGPIWQVLVDAKTDPPTFRAQLRAGRIVRVDGVCAVLETDDRVNFGPFVRNKWHDFVVHVKWSFGRKGLFELWHNGMLVQRVNGPTLMDDRYAYWKQGNYRPASWDQPSAIYQDGFRRGNSYADVAPRR